MAIRSAAYVTTIPVSRQASGAYASDGVRAVLDRFPENRLSTLGLFCLRGPHAPQVLPLGADAHGRRVFGARRMVGMGVLQPLERFDTASAEWLLAPIDTISTVEGVSTIAEFIVAIDRITYYAVQA